MKITPIRKEVDAIVLEVVHKRSSQAQGAAKSIDEVTMDTLTSQYLGDSVSSLNEAGVRQVYTFVRDESGAGKSRQIAKTLCLLRPESVFCLFGVSPRASNRKSLRALQNSNLSFSRIGVSTLSKDHFDTIVATDDIFLRQRIVQAGGYVVTFEQLWNMLQP